MAFCIVSLQFADGVLDQLALLALEYQEGNGISSHHALIGALVIRAHRGVKEKHSGGGEG